MPISNDTRSTGLKAGCLSAVLILSSSLQQPRRSALTTITGPFPAVNTFSIYRLQAAGSLSNSVCETISPGPHLQGLQLVPEGGDLAATAIGSRKKQQEENTFYKCPGCIRLEGPLLWRIKGRSETSALPTRRSSTFLSESWSLTFTTVQSINWSLGQWRVTHCPVIQTRTVRSCQVTQK